MYQIPGRVIDEDSLQKLARHYDEAKELWDLLEERGCEEIFTTGDVKRVTQPANRMQTSRLLRNLEDAGYIDILERAKGHEPAFYQWSDKVNWDSLKHKFREASPSGNGSSSPQNGNGNRPAERVASGGNRVVVHTAQVDVKIVRIGKKQMTLSMFRQLEEETIFGPDGTLKGNPWGKVLYTWKDSPKGTLFYVIWEKGGKIKRCPIPKVDNLLEPGWVDDCQLSSLKVEIRVYEDLEEIGQRRGPWHDEAERKLTELRWKFIKTAASLSQLDQLFIAV